MHITKFSPTHAKAALEIYQQGIDSGIATFETVAPSWEKFDAKFLPQCRLVAIDNGIIAGWAALTAVSARECYKGVAEVSIYILNIYRGKGVGRKLLTQLIAESEQQGFWSLLAVMHEENAASIQLHNKCGFRTIGCRERIAQLHGEWKTTVMMERRSNIAGC